MNAEQHGSVSAAEASAQSQEKVKEQKEISKAALTEVVEILNMGRSS